MHELAIEHAMVKAQNRITDQQPHVQRSRLARPDAPLVERRAEFRIGVYECPVGSFAAAPGI